MESCPLRVTAKVTVMTYKALQQTLFTSASLTLGARSFSAVGLSCALQGIWLYRLNTKSTPPRDVRTKNVSRHFQMSPKG